MCLLTYERESKTATRDIVCWKILIKLGKEYITPYQNDTVVFDKPTYAKNKYYKKLSDLKIISTLSMLDEVQEGLHGFKIKSSALWHHHIAFTHEAYKDITYVIVKMVIPKGAKYIESYDRKEIVATEAVYLKETIKIIK